MSQENTCRDSCKKRLIGTVSVHAGHVDVVMAETREEKEIVAYMSLGIVTSPPHYVLGPRAALEQHLQLSFM